MAHDAAPCPLGQLCLDDRGGALGLQPERVAGNVGLLAAGSLIGWDVKIPAGCHRRGVHHGRKLGRRELAACSLLEPTEPRHVLVARGFVSLKCSD